MPSIFEKLEKSGFDKKKLDGWVDEGVFVGKENAVFVVKSDTKTKVIKTG